MCHETAFACGLGTSQWVQIQNAAILLWPAGFWVCGWSRWFLLIQLHQNAADGQTWAWQEAAVYIFAPNRPKTWQRRRQGRIMTYCNPITSMVHSTITPRYTSDLPNCSLYRQAPRNTTVFFIVLTVKRLHLVDIIKPAGMYTSWHTQRYLSRIVKVFANDAFKGHVKGTASRFEIGLCGMHIYIYIYIYTHTHTHQRCHLVNRTGSLLCHSAVLYLIIQVRLGFRGFHLHCEATLLVSITGEHKLTVSYSIKKQFVLRTIFSFNGIREWRPRPTLVQYSTLQQSHQLCRYQLIA